jgi:hypothetical protein
MQHSYLHSHHSYHGSKRVASGFRPKQELPVEFSNPVKSGEIGLTREVSLNTVHVSFVPNACKGKYFKGMLAFLWNS